MTRPVLLAASLLLVCFSVGSHSRAVAAVFRDRTQFVAASQNLRTIDFEAEPPGFSRDLTIDGILFENPFSSSSIVSFGNVPTKVLRGNSAGEITTLTVYLPPGTTAVGCDQFTSPMTVNASPGEGVTMSASDQTTFVGFVSDKPIQTLTFFLDSPEPTGDVLLDNLTYGQRRVGDEPPAPQLLFTSDTGRAVALDSVTKTSEPFSVVSMQSLSADGHTRIALFLVGVVLDPADAASVTAQAEDAQHRVFDLPVEAVGRVKNLSWMAQVIVRLPDGLSGAGDVSVGVNARGAASNKVTLRIGPPFN
jgi:hypothetical protein